MATVLNGYPEKSCHIALPVDFISLKIFSALGHLIFFPTATVFPDLRSCWLLCLCRWGEERLVDMAQVAG